SSVMRKTVSKGIAFAVTPGVGIVLAAVGLAQPGPEDFATMRKRMELARPAIQKTHAVLLDQRYDLGNRAAPGPTMSRGKPLQAGPRTRLPDGITWQKLAALSPEEIKEQGLFPAGFLPLPHPHHAEGGMLFPKFHIDEIRKQEG